MRDELYYTCILSTSRTTQRRYGRLEKKNRRVEHDIMVKSGVVTPPLYVGSPTAI